MTNLQIVCQFSGASFFLRSCLTLLPLKAEIICIGDELLIGQVINTNAAWIGEQLGLAGISVVRSSCISDSEKAIREAMDYSQLHSDLIIITGGLGPTNDDITKKTLCEYFGMKWRTDEKILMEVEKFFLRYGKTLNEVNRLQAQVPDGCIAIANKNGTAPGMWFEQDEKIFISMPGVPYEMKGMMSDEVIPMLKKKFSLPFIYHKTVHTLGIGESILAERIADWEKSLALFDIKLAYLPSPAMVRLRMSASGVNEKEITECVNKKSKELIPLVGGYIFGYENDTIEKVAGDLLRSAKKTLALAESCTGGMIAHLITSVPGSSDYFKGGIISYADEVKTKELGIQEKIIAEHGVVSEEVVRMMAQHARKKFNTDYALSTSGIAGPSGGTIAKPVGTVWMAVSGAEGTFSRKMQFGDNRERNILRASVMALGMLRKFILGELKET
ncbi:MAG: competence/damage-inducible protein A [Bacteroidetes bacterium]|nr:competence/damage-inducible protein A [Bacteroidota bacterium]